MNRYVETRYYHRGGLAGLGQDSGADTFMNTTPFDYGTDAWPASVDQAPVGDGLFTQAEIDAILSADSASQPPANASQLPEVAKWLTAGLSLAQAWQVSQINITRAQRGQPLLNASQISALSPRMNVGVAADTQKMLMIGAGLLAAVVLLKK